MTGSPSPFAQPAPGLRVKPFVATLPRPTRDEIAAFPAEARALLDRIWAAQVPLPETVGYNLHWIAGRHFLLAGGTGTGLGGSLATALLHHLDQIGSLTVISRDLRRSVEFEMGAAMQERAEQAGQPEKVRWLNDGMALEGEGFEKIVATLRAQGAGRVIYVNAVAAAHSGVLPGMPPIFVKDFDEAGLFQWELPPLSEKAVETTKFVMGTMATLFPLELERAGIAVEATGFCDWRGSLDGCSRVPTNVEYGRQGPYSTSLYLPKTILQRAASEAYRSGRRVIDVFLPLMKTRALFLIPGGRILWYVYSRLLRDAGIKRLDVPELGVAVLDLLGKALVERDDNPFPRLDTHEVALDLYFFEVLKRLNNDPASEFYFLKWIDEEA